jgi:hypothetical protein
MAILSVRMTARAIAALDALAAEQGMDLGTP